MSRFKHLSGERLREGEALKGRIREADSALDALRALRALQSGSRRLWTSLPLADLAQALGVPVREEDVAEAEAAAARAKEGREPGLPSPAAARAAGAPLSVVYWRRKQAARAAAKPPPGRDNPIVFLGLKRDEGRRAGAGGDEGAALPHPAAPVPSGAAALLAALAPLELASPARGGLRGDLPAATAAAAAAAAGAPALGDALSTESATRAFKLQALQRSRAAARNAEKLRAEEAAARARLSARVHAALCTFLAATIRAAPYSREYADVLNVALRVGARHRDSYLRVGLPVPADLTLERVVARLVGGGLPPEGPSPRLIALEGLLERAQAALDAPALPGGPPILGPGVQEITAAMVGAAPKRRAPPPDPAGAFTLLATAVVSGDGGDGLTPRAAAEAAADALAARMREEAMMRGARQWFSALAEAAERAMADPAVSADGVAAAVARQPLLLSANEGLRSKSPVGGEAGVF
jgi:hypothetical protein